MSDDLTDDFLRETTRTLYYAVGEHGPGIVATIIETHGIYASDRYGRMGHRAPDSVQAASALDFCAQRCDFLRWCYANFEDPADHLEDERQDGGEIKPHPLDGAGWPIEEFSDLLAAAKRARVDAVGQAAAQREVEVVNARRREDQAKLDATNAVLLGAVLALLRGEIKDARNAKTVTYESEAQIQRVLVALRDAGNNFRGLSQATIERRFAEAKGYFPLKGSHTVALGG